MWLEELTIPLQLERGYVFKDRLQHFETTWQIKCETHVVFVQSQMVCGQHSDSQARAQRRVQEAAQDRLVLQRQDRELLSAYC